MDRRYYIIIIERLETMIIKKIEGIDKEDLIIEILEKRNQKRCCDCVWADVSSGAAIICGRLCNHKTNY